MAERANPDSEAFKGKLCVRWKWRIVPVLEWKPNPYRMALKRRYRWVNRHCRGKSVLDVPCGMGWGTSMLRSARRVVGVDVDRDAVAEASTRYPHFGEFKVGDMSTLDFDDGEFDVVCCLEGIEHVSREIGEKFIREAARCLGKEGELFLSSPYCTMGGHSGNPYHIHEYRPEEILQLVRPYFSVVEQTEVEVDVLTVVYLQLRVRG